MQSINGVQNMIPKDKIVNFWCALGKSHEHGQNIMGVPVTVAIGNAYYVFSGAHGNSHAHAHAYSHGHARDYVHGHVHYWQTCVPDLQRESLNIWDELCWYSYILRSRTSNFEV